MDWIGTGIGTTILAGIVAAWLAVRRQWGYAALIIVAPAISVILNHVLKVLLDSPRPTPDIDRIIGEASGQGFPSGHAMRGMICYGLILVIATRLIESRRPRRLVQLVAVLMVTLSGLARVYLGVHWPSDIVGGYLWGAVVLIALVSAYDELRARTHAASP